MYNNTIPVSDTAVSAEQTKSYSFTSPGIQCNINQQMYFTLTKITFET